MAIKPCRECKQPVSTQADYCPHCGAVVGRNVGCFTAAIIVFGLLALAISLSTVFKGC